MGLTVNKIRNTFKKLKILKRHAAKMVLRVFFIDIIYSIYINIKVLTFTFVYYKIIMMYNA